MANVTIKLTVDTEAVLNNKTQPDLGTNCRLSQSGGEEIGNYMVVNLSDTRENESNVTINDVITWTGIPASGNGETKVNILAITRENSGEVSVLGSGFEASWYFGNTITRQVISDASERYTIIFSIATGKDSEPVIFQLDPKIKGHINTPI